LKVEYRRDYFDRIHDEELEGQLKKVEVDRYIEPVICHQLLERAQLQEAVCDLSIDISPSDIVSRRIRVIDLMVALSYRQEQAIQYSNQSSRTYSESSEKPHVSEEPQGEAHFPLVCKKTQCITCIGDDRSTFEYRTRTYSTPHKMMNHVDSHLKDVPKLLPFFCTHPVCRSEDLVLQHLQHFKNHV